NSFLRQSSSQARAKRSGAPVAASGLLDRSALANDGLVSILPRAIGAAAATPPPCGSRKSGLSAAAARGFRARSYLRIRAGKGRAAAAPAPRSRQTHRGRRAGRET